MVALIAVAHRAHRLAFAMCRNQQPYDPDMWVRNVERRRAAKAAIAT
jgi:transposase